MKKKMSTKICIGFNEDVICIKFFSDFLKPL